MYVFPKRMPQMLQSIHTWHLRLLKTCMELEFEERALKAGLAELDRQIKKYVSWMKEDEGIVEEARTILIQLNKVKSSWNDRLIVNKMTIRTAHDTNMLIVGSMLHSHGIKIDRSHTEKSRQPGSNLLHEPGLLSEIAYANLIKKRGDFPFLTFGTDFDSKGVDVVVVPGPNRRVTWNTEKLEREFPGFLKAVHWSTKRLKKH